MERKAILAAWAAHRQRFGGDQIGRSPAKGRARHRGSSRQTSSGHRERDIDVSMQRSVGHSTDRGQHNTSHTKADSAKEDKLVVPKLGMNWRSSKGFSLSRLVTCLNERYTKLLCVSDDDHTVSTLFLDLPSDVKRMPRLRRPEFGAALIELKTMNKKALLARRIREIRLELYGENGLPTLAQSLKVPAETWLNYERGVTMPADVLLEFLELTGADPQSLLTGETRRPVIRID